MRHCKGAWSAAWATTFAVVGSGCLYTWSPPVTLQRRVEAAPVLRRADGVLPGRGELLPDGRFRFTVALDELCTHDRRVTERVRTRSHRELSGVGFGAIGLSLAGAGTGAYLTADGTAEGVALLAFTVVAAGMIIAGRWFPPSSETSDRELVQGEGVDVVPCPDVATALGELELVTPWAGVPATPAGPDGRVTFDVNWTAFAPDPRDPGTRELLAHPWEVKTSTGLRASWQPGDADVQLASKQLELGRDRVVTGPTEPSLSVEFTVGGDAIVLGRPATLTVTVGNSGQSTAVDVEVRTRSAVPELHGLRFAFGLIQPGQRATRQLEVKLTTSTRGESAQLLLVVGERDGHVPAETAVKVALQRGLCPEGKLTRAQYDKKRAKLAAAVDAGAMTQADFEALDADLLRCLE